MARRHNPQRLRRKLFLRRSPRVTHLRPMGALCRQRLRVHGVQRIR